MTGLIEVSGGIAELVAGDCGEIRDLDNWKDDRENCPGPFTKEECAAADKAARIARAAPELLEAIKRASPVMFGARNSIRDGMTETQKAEMLKALNSGLDMIFSAIAKAEGAQ